MSLLFYQVQSKFVSPTMSRYVLVLVLSISAVTAINEEYFDEELRCVWNCYREYSGILRTTINGKKCRRWKAEDFSLGDADVFNPHSMHDYCRTVNGKAMPWCYIEGGNETDWEYCFHSHCKHSPRYKRKPRNRCKEGFFEFEGKCYSVLKEPVHSRSEGRTSCEQLSAELVSLGSEDEVRFVSSLTCLPALVSVKKRRSWKWMDGTDWGLEEDSWLWCHGNRENSKNCSTLTGASCLKRIDCSSSEPLYPACSYVPVASENLVTVQDITWSLAREECEGRGRHLCTWKDLCSVPGPKANLSSYKSLLLPLEGEKWVPISDEYNDWMYVGGDEYRKCRRHNEEYGPPFWGIDPTYCQGDLSPRYEQFCSSIGDVICCEGKAEMITKTYEVPTMGGVLHDSQPMHDHPMESEVIPIPQESETGQVPIYVQSRMQDGVPFYHFSLEQNRTVKEVKMDKEQWRNAGRTEGDLRKFTLMSAYERGVAEDVIYFCVRDAMGATGLSTTVHKISTTQCDDDWRLNFYAYGMLNETLLKSGVTFMTLVVTDNEGGSRVETPDNDSSDPPGLKIFTPLPPENLIEKAPITSDPCGGVIQRVRAKVGIISSPNYPRKYPRTNPPISCGWKIVADEDNVIKITFTAMNLDSDVDSDHLYYSFVSGYERFRVSHGNRVFNHQQNCTGERVLIQDPLGRRERDNWVKYGTFCGDWEPNPFITTDHALSVRFYGSSRKPSSGFSLIYEAIAPPRGLKLERVEGRKRVKITWKRARRMCDEVGKDLCYMEDVCKYGRPFYGVEQNDKWVPVLNEYNDWVQIGRHMGQTCQRYNPIYGPPQWGITEGMCDGGSSVEPCPQKEFVYCCDPPKHDPIILLNQEGLPVENEVTIKVYTTVQNGRVFYRYIRDGIDNINKTSIWSPGSHYASDLTTIKFYSKYKKGHSKVVYFCFKPLVLAIGQLQTAYAMFSQPCHLKEWRLLFYLYSSDVPQENMKKIFIGISTLQPYHSRATFNSFPPLYRGLDGFIIYANTPDFAPDVSPNNPNTTERVIDTCSFDPVVIIAPSVLVSPGYPEKYKSDMECKWRIRLSDSHMDLGVKLKLTIEELHLEDRSDFLLIYDAPLNVTLDDLSYRDAREFTGVVRHVTLVTNNSFLMTFKSDYSIEKRGFKIRAEVINDKCGGMVTKHGSTVTSQNYPSPYKGGLNCTWGIQAPNPGYGVEIQFGKFELEESDNCDRDYITLGPPSDPEKYVFCGVKDRPPRVQFNESEVLINFVSYHRKLNERKGFIFNVFFWPRGSLAGVGTAGTQCGVQNILPWGNSKAGAARDRIYGGLEAVPGSWPWLVRIPLATCGGVLLNNRWVLSASHCFADKKLPGGGWSLKYPASNYTIVAGRHHRTSKSHNEQVFSVEQIIMHPGYARKKLGEAGHALPSGLPLNDIALVKLAQTAIFSDTVTPVCLPTQEVMTGETCVIAGWGAQELLASLSGTRVNTLHYAHVHVLENSLCNSYVNLRGSVTDDMLCAGYPGGGVDSCQGDSGGPLMCKVPNKGYEVKGVISWGRGCGKPEQPGIYTRVWSYYDWITSHIHS